MRFLRNDSGGEGGEVGNIIKPTSIGVVLMLLIGILMPLMRFLRNDSGGEGGEVGNIIKPNSDKQLFCIFEPLKNNIDVIDL